MKRKLIRSYTDFYPVANRIVNFFAEEVVIDDDTNLKELVSNQPKLICVSNHGPVLAPLLYSLGMAKILCDVGAGDRKPVAVTHRLFYRVPGLKQVASYITQVPKPVNFNQFVELFQSEGYNDLCVMPEGDHCNYGNGADIMPFRSPRFVEIALRCRVPILIFVNKGAEAWGRGVKLPTVLVEKTMRYLPESIADPLDYAHMVNLPKIPRKVPQLRVSAQLFQLPDIDFEALSESEKKQEVVSLAGQVRRRMLTMTESMDT